MTRSIARHGIALAASVLPWSWVIAHCDPGGPWWHAAVLLSAAHELFLIALLAAVVYMFWNPPPCPQPSDTDTDQRSAGGSAGDDSSPESLTESPTEPADESMREMLRTTARKVAASSASLLGFLVFVELLTLPSSPVRAILHWLPIATGVLFLLALSVWSIHDWRQNSRLLKLAARLDAGDRTLRPADLTGYSWTNAVLAADLVGWAYVASGHADRLPHLINVPRGNGRFAELSLAPIEIIALHKTGQTDEAKQRLAAYRSRFADEDFFALVEPFVMWQLGLPGYEEREAALRRDLRQQAVTDHAFNELQAKLASRDRILADPTLTAAWQETLAEYRSELGR